MTTSAFGTSAAASACHSERKPSTPAAGRASRTGTAAARSRSRRRRAAAARRRGGSRSRAGRGRGAHRPARGEHSACVPGPIGSIRNASSPGGARQRLIGRGSSRPGASSMKNCPGCARLEPAALDPQQRVRARRPRGYETVRRSRLGIDALLQRQRELGARVRDRVHGGGGAGDRRDARARGRPARPRGSGSRPCAGASRRRACSRRGRTCRAGRGRPRSPSPPSATFATSLDLEPGRLQRPAPSLRSRRAGSRGRPALRPPAAAQACRRRAPRGTPCPRSAAAGPPRARPSRTRSAGRRRRPSPRRSSASPARAPGRCRGSARTAAPPP